MKRALVVNQDFHRYLLVIDLRAGGSGGSCYLRVLDTDSRKYVVPEGCGEYGDLQTVVEKDIFGLEAFSRQPRFLRHHIDRFKVIPPVGEDETIGLGRRESRVQNVNELWQKYLLDLPTLEDRQLEEILNGGSEGHNAKAQVSKCEAVSILNPLKHVIRQVDMKLYQICFRSFHLGEWKKALNGSAARTTYLSP